MESVSLEMDDIFEDRMNGGEDEYDDDALPPRLPDLPEGLEDGVQNDQEAENKEVLAKLKGMKGAAKNTVKRPQPKLDSNRLTGERGIPVLPHIFKDVKLKGKGHEAEDLRVVMRYLEHWAHRLFPKMPFDEVLERIERLGTKREVQTCIKKMRLDMPVLGQDMVGRDDDDDDDDNEEKQQQPSTQNQQQKTAADLFDELLREEEELREESQASRPRAQHNEPSEGSNSAAMPSAASATPSTGLSADVLERMERNRRMAVERRAIKTGGPLPSQTSSGRSAPVHQSPTSTTANEGSQQDGPEITLSS